MHDDRDVDDVAVVVVPLRSHLAPVTALVAVTEPDSWLLDVQDRELFAGFADQVALSLDRTQALADRQELALISDRERIARDLHDIVIQRLFATGPAAAGRRRDGRRHAAVSERLDKAVADLDDTIKAIRGTIFELQDRRGDSLRAGVRRLVKEYVPVLGFTPVVRTSGPVDTAVPARARHPAARGAARGDLQRRPARPRRQRRGRRRGDARAARAAGGRRRRRPAGRGVARAACATHADAPTTSAARSRSRRSAPRGTVLVWRVPLG